MSPQNFSMPQLSVLFSSNKQSGPSWSPLDWDHYPRFQYT
jgi:hypothetical protein